MKITRKSMFSGGINTLDIDVTEGQLLAWQNGTLIQDAMPDLSAEEREFIMTGITPEEWKKEFGEDNDDTYQGDEVKKAEPANPRINGIEVIGEIPDTPYVDGIWPRADGQGWVAWHKSPGGSSSIWSSDRASVEKWLEDSIRGTREFWEEKIRWSIDGYPRDASTMVLRINGQHYVAKPGIKKTNRLNRDCLGFAGRVFRWEMLNAPGYIYECNDVWSQGKIPPEFADRLPDNARWA